MSRVVLAAAVLMALSFPMSAQRGGMHAGGGGARMAMGRGPAPMGFARAPQMRPQFFPPRTAAFARPRSALVGTRPALVPRQRGFFITTQHTHGGPFVFTPGFSGRFGHHFHNHAFFYALPYYYGAYSPYYDDYWNPDSFGSYAYDPTANTSSYNDLSNQISQLSSEMQQLHDENDSLRSSLYEQQRPPVPTPSATIATTSGNEPATVLVYRDGHRAEVQNYAIVGSTVWILSSTRATKVPLSELDLDRTAKINEDRGVSFQVPKN